MSSWQDDPIVSGGGAATMPQPAGNSWEDDPIVAPAPQTFKSHMLPPPTGESRGPGLQLPAPQSAIQPFERDAMVRHFTENPGSESSYAPISEQDLTPSLRNAYDANVKAWNDQAGGNEPIPGVVTDTPTQNYTPNPYIWKLPNGGYMIQKAAAANAYKQGFNAMAQNPVGGVEQGMDSYQQAAQIEQNRQMIQDQGLGTTGGLHQVAESTQSLTPQDRQDIAQARGGFLGRPRPENTGAEDREGFWPNVGGRFKRTVGGIMGQLGNSRVPDTRPASGFIGRREYDADYAYQPTARRDAVSPGLRNAGENLIQSGNDTIANNPVDSTLGKGLLMAPEIAGAVAAGAATGGMGLFAFGAAQATGNTWANTFEEVKAKTGNVEQARQAASAVAPVSGIVGGIMQTLRLPMGSPAASAVENVVQNVLIHTTNGAAIGAVQSWADQLAQQAATGRPIDEKAILESAAQNGLISGAIHVAHTAIGAVKPSLTSQIRSSEPPLTRPQSMETPNAPIDYAARPPQPQDQFAARQGTLGEFAPQPLREPVQPPQSPERANQGRETVPEQPNEQRLPESVVRPEQAPEVVGGTSYDPNNREHQERAESLAELEVARAAQAEERRTLKASEMPAERVGARTATEEGSARLEQAKQRQRDIINNPDIVGRQRADMIANGRNLIGFLETHANTTRPFESGVERGDAVAYTGEDAPEGFRSFIYLEGHKAGEYGVSRTPEARSKDIANNRNARNETQADFARIRESGQSDQMPPAPRDAVLKGRENESGNTEPAVVQADTAPVAGGARESVNRGSEGPVRNERPGDAIRGGDATVPGTVPETRKDAPLKSAGKAKSGKPRLAENADDLYEQIVSKTAEGVVGPEGKVLYPVVSIVGEGQFNVTKDGITKVGPGGITNSPATDAQVQAVHDAIDSDTAEVILKSRWGGSGATKSVMSKGVKTLHSPSGLGFKSLDEVLAKNRGTVSQLPKPKDAALQAKVSESATPPVSAKEPPAPTGKESLIVADKPVGESPKPPTKETSAEKKARIAAMTDAELAKAMRNPKPGESSLLIGEQSKRERANEPSKLDAIQENLEGRLKDVQNAKAKRAASNRGKGKRSGMAQGPLDPQELLLKGMISGVKIVRKVKDFATWSAEMIKEVGSDISEHLAAIWSHIAPNSEDRIASVANAELDLDRIVRGLSPMDDVATRPRQVALDEARAKIRDNPNAAIELVESLTRTPRGLTDTDVMMLVHRKAELQNAWQKNHEYGETAQEAGNAENATDAAHNEYFLNTQLDQLDKVIGKGEGSSSTATARALSAMNSQLNEERYTTANIEQRARAANLYEPLNEGERKQLDDLRKKHDAAQKADADGKSGDGSGRANGAHEQAKSDAADEAAGERKQGVNRDTKKTIESLTAGLKDAAKDGPPSNLADWIKDIHRAVIRDGFTERDAAIDKVHEIVSGILPGMTRRQVMDAMIHSPYKELSKDEIEVQRRAHNGEILQLTRIDDALNKNKLGDRRGIEQAPLTDEGRKLKREYDELVKKLDLRPSDPANNDKQLKSALESMKTRVGNRIADLKRQLKYGAKDNFEGGKPKSDADLEAKQGELKELQEVFDSVFDGEVARNEATREEQLRRQISELNSQLAGETAKAKADGKADTKSPVIKDLESRRDALMQERYDSQDARLERATKAARAEAARWQERHDHARLGEFENGKARTDVVTSEEIDALKAWSKATAAEVKMLDQAASVRKEQARIEAKQKKADQLRERLQTGDLSVRGRKPTVEAKDYVAAANEVARLNKEIAAARRDSPDGIQAELWRRRANVERQIAEGQERLRTGDFTKKPRRTPAVEIDPDARQRQADLNEVRKNIDRAIEAIRLKNRTKFEKAMDLTVKWKRSAVLSWPTTFMKLTAAAGEGMVFAPADEVSGMIWNKLFPNVSAQAPREGGGLSLSAEMKAIGSFGQSLRDSWRMVRGKESKLDALHGDMRDMPRSFLDYAGVLHGAFKNPLKWNEYTRSVEKRLARAAKMGEDITDPIVQMRHMTEAYKDAKRSIFMQDNRVVNMVKRGLSALAEPKPSGEMSLLGKAAGTLAKSDLPILRIPTNLVAATFERMFGTFAGLTEIGYRKAFGKGLKNLHPDEADAIMRHLKKGSLGAAGLLAGFFMPGSVGGYGKRDDKDIEAGSLKVFGIEIPKLLLHNPLMETLQIGATIRRIMDSKLHKHDKENAGISRGMYAAAMGLLDETPIVREIKDTAKALDFRTDASPGQRAAHYGASFVPGLAQWMAQKFDQDPKAKEMWGIPGTRKATARAPETAVDELKKTIPGLRNQVPPAANTENLKHLHTAYKKLLELGDEADAAEMMQRMQDEAKNPTGEDPMKAQKEKVKAEHEASKKPEDVENERKQGIEKVKRDYQLRSERIKGNNLLQSQP